MCADSSTRDVVLRNFLPDPTHSRCTQVFNCNVGHIADGYDWTKSNRWNYKMMKHLAEDPQAGSKGFVSDLVCEFPYNLINETRSWRQINFSAWYVDLAPKLSTC